MFEETHFLKELSDIAKTLDNPVDRITYKYGAFRNSFHDTIVKIFMNKSDLPDDFNLVLDHFNIEFDNKRNAYIYAYNPVTRKSLAIISDGIFYDGLPSGIRMNESTFMNILFGTEMNSYNNLAKNPENKPYLISPYLVVDNVLKEYKEAFESIGKYIIGLDKMKKRKEEKELKSDLGSITFIENDAPQVKREGIPNSFGIQSERKTEEMPLLERLEILDKYPYKYKSDEVSGYSKDGVQSSSYKVRVYEVKPKTVIVMEPFEDNKRIKVRYVDMNEEKLSNLKTNEKTMEIDDEGEKILSIIQESLQFNRSEISERDDMTRHNHKGMDNYEKLIKYLVTGIDDGIPISSKNNIDHAMKTR